MLKLNHRFAILAECSAFASDFSRTTDTVQSAVGRVEGSTLRIQLYAPLGGYPGECGL